MKIGIMTYWWSQDNYGQIMQCYALQKYLRDEEHDAFLIRYNSAADFNKTPLLFKLFKLLNPSHVRNFIGNKRSAYLHSKEITVHPRDFDSFRDRYIRQTDLVYHSYDSLRDNPPDADAYIVGSDQIWNFQNLPLYKVFNIMNAWFLNFGGAKTKRLSYAASFGSDSVSKQYAGAIKPLIERFDYVSVREKTGVSICAACGVDGAEWVPDPTLLLGADTYRSLYAENSLRKPEKPYVLLYLLSNPCELSIAKVYDWAASKSLDVQYVTGNAQHDEYPKNYSTVPEWLYLIDHAEYVITNSFHGTVFSCIFRKRFAVVPLKGKVYESMNNRIYSLFERLNIPRTFLENDDFSVFDKMGECQAVTPQRWTQPSFLRS